MDDKNHKAPNKLVVVGLGDTPVLQQPINQKDFIQLHKAEINNLGSDNNNLRWLSYILQNMGFLLFGIFVTPSLDTQWKFYLLGLLAITLFILGLFLTLHCNKKIKNIITSKAPDNAL